VGGDFNKKDFFNKLGMTLRESRETEYWLRLLKELETINGNEFVNVFADCEELFSYDNYIIKIKRIILNYTF